MKLKHVLLAAACLAAPLPAYAQSARTGNDDQIVVNGQLNKDGKPIPMSDWYVAETEHVLVYARGDRARLVRIAHNLEKEHFLLSMLLDRVDQPDDAIKLRVTLIGDAADFDQLALTNMRWQQGPYPRDFPNSLYYDPREDGAVLATPLLDQKIILQQSWGKPSSPDVKPDGAGQSDRTDLGKPAATSDPSNANPNSGAAQDFAAGGVNEDSVVVTADSRIYAGYAQHYLLTYFPATYPRWYIEGFGEIFSTLNADKDGVVEYGRQPDSFRKVMTKYGYYPVEKLMAGNQLDERRWFPRWTPYEAWALAHMLFFSDEWRAPLHEYLAALGNGQAPMQAAAKLGDLDKLQRQLTVYHGRKAPFERLTYPADRAPPPLVRQLTRSEASYVKGKLELGARLDLPPPAPAGSDAKTIAKADEARREAIRRRDAWLEDQRRNAAKYPEDLEYQELVAEAECRSGNSQGCLDAAERVLRTAPTRPAALAWKGVALTQLAMAGPAEGRAARLAAARKLIVQANHGEPEAVQPLLAYYRSYVDAGLTPPDNAAMGLVKAGTRSPSAPTIRLMLAEELVRRGDAEAAAKMLRPIANGPFDMPERPRARQLLASLPQPAQP